MKHYLILSILMSMTLSGAYAQNYFDDVYYNPKKDNSSSTTSKKKSNYIANMADMDIDAYNRRDSQYYTGSVDTIGMYVENGEDFVYTQQIQKYYNPTIVVENANLLNDVLANAYGNVEIVINNDGIPIFSPWYGYNSPYYYWGNPWTWWGSTINPWWNVGFYDPRFYWNIGWGPSWSWNWSPAWGWNWGPSWGWGSPGWGWGAGWGHGHWHPDRPMANWRPNGNRPVNPGPGWNAGTRPGGNMAQHNPGGGRGPMGVQASGNTNPGSNNGRPSGVVNNNGKWQYNTTATTGHRQSGTGVMPGSVNNKVGNSNTVVNNGGSQSQHRGNNSVTTTNRNNTSTTIRNNSSTTNRNNSSTTIKNNSSTTTNRTNTFNNSSNHRTTTGTPSRNTGGGRSTGGGGGRHR